MRAITLLLVCFLFLVSAPFGQPFAAAQSCPQGWFGGTAIPESNTSRAMIEWSPRGDPEGSLLVVGCGFESSLKGNVFAWDGLRWLDLAGTVDGAVVALRVHKGDLFVAGSFQHIGGIEAHGIARFDGTTWHALPEQPAARLILGVSIEVFEGDIVVAGRFTLPNNVQIYRAARYRNSEWQMMKDSNSPIVYPHLLISHKGELFLISDANFNDYMDLFRWNGVRWDLVQSFDGYIWDAVSFGDELFLVSQRAVHYPGFLGSVAAWNGTTWRPVGAPGEMVQGFKLVVHDGALHAHLHRNTPSDLFTVERLDGNSWTVLHGETSSGYTRTLCDLQSWRGKLCTLAWSGTLMRASIVENGSLAPITFPLLPLQGLSRAVPDEGRVAISRLVGSPSTYAAELWDGTVATPLGSTFNGQIRTFFRDNGTLYAGGDFARVGANNVLGVARFDGTDWRALGAGLPGNVNSLCTFRGDLYASGNFRVTAPTPLTRIARWDGSLWQPVAAGIGSPTTGGSTVTAMLVFNDRLIVGGTFTTASGVTVRNVASWDGQSWSPMGSLPVAASFLFLHQGTLIAASQLRGADSVWRWTGSEWVSIAPAIQRIFGGCFHDGRLALLSTDGLGLIKSPDGTDAEFHAAKFDPSYPCVIFSHGDALQIVGQGGSLGGLVEPGRSEWSDVLPPAILRDPVNAHACAGNDTVLRAGAVDALPLSYRWEKDGSPIADGPHFSGATTPELRLLDARRSMIGFYQCIISRDCAEVRTSAANVSICYADFNCDGLVETSDFELFVVAYNELIVPPAEPRFDQNEDGVVDDLDFQLFIDAYNRCDCHATPE